MWINYLNHIIINDFLVDYYEKEQNGIKKYILKVDGKTIYEGEEQLTEDQIKQMVYSL